MANINMSLNVIKKNNNIIALHLIVVNISSMIEGKLLWHCFCISLFWSSQAMLGLH